MHSLETSLHATILKYVISYVFFFSSRRRHTRSKRDWSSDVCSSDLPSEAGTYLAACVFYATIFRESPKGLGYHGSVSAEVAAKIQSVAAETVLADPRSEEHTSELQSRFDLVCRLLLEKKNNQTITIFLNHQVSSRKVKHPLNKALALKGKVAQTQRELQHQTQQLQ